jgi:integrase
MPRYLQKVGHTYYARVKVPRTLTPVVGQSHLRVSLHTRDPDEAERRKWRAVAQLKGKLTALRKTGNDPALKKARTYRAQLADLQRAGDHDMVGAVAEFALEDAQQLERDRGTQLAETFLSVAVDGALTVSELSLEWLAATADRYSKQTSQQHQRAAEELRGWLKGDVTPLQVSDAVAVRYVEEGLEGAYATRRRKLNSLVSFWEWMALRAYVPRRANPWRGFRLSKKADAARDDKRPYSESELLVLLGGSPKYPGLAHLVILGLLTGARLDELASLRIDDVQPKKDSRGRYLLVSIKRAKTKAGVRSIAVAHPQALAVLSKRLVGKGNVFPELRPGGYDAKLSWAVSKAFGRYRTGLGLPSAVDFHSTRRTFITTLENLGVDQVRIARYVGHTLPTLAFSLYSGGSSEQTSVQVARTIRYSPAVESSMQEFLVQEFLERGRV